MTNALTCEQLHVWYCPTDAPSWPQLQPYYLSLLAPDERERHARFRFERDQRSFLLAHVLAREVLSRYAPVAAGSWEFTTTAKGKPRIAAPRQFAHLQFSYSHAAEVVACAMTCSSPVGVDVESADRDIDLRIARHCLSTNEMHRFQDLDESAQRTMLLRCWTLKEALAKALGSGFAMGFSQYAFGDCAGDRPCLVETGPEIRVSTDWQFHQTRLDDRYQLAVAAKIPELAPVEFMVRCLVPSPPDRATASNYPLIA